MKFSKHQKNIIRLIQSGDIYDISSYLKYFNKGCTIKLSKETVNERFFSDNLPKTYYRKKNLQHTRGNTLTSNEYNEKLNQNLINPNNYIAESLKLSYSSGIKHETWENNLYTIDFYKGVYIPNDFNDILNFLTLWQYLKSEMLIFEVPQDCNSEILGLFYEHSSDTINHPHSLEEQLGYINYDDLTYADTHYIDNEIYIFSHEHCSMCRDYLDKKLYPTTKLTLFVKKNFKTYEETTQNRALFVAWLAIFVSIFLTIAPNLYPHRNTEMDSLLSDINEIKDSINLQRQSSEVSSTLDSILKKLDLITDQLTMITTGNSPEVK